MNEDRQPAAVEPLTASAKAGAEPGSILPSAESHSGQLGSHAGSALVTRTKRIGGSPRDRAGGLRSA